MRSAQKTSARKRMTFSMISGMTIFALATSLLATGCSADEFSWGRSARRPSKTDVTPPPPADQTKQQPLADKAPSRKDKPKKQTEQTNVDAEVAPIHQRIQDYMGRFPDDDLTRKANGYTQQTAVASPAAPQEAASAPTEQQKNRPHQPLPRP